MSLRLLTMGSEYISTGYGREDCRMRHSITIGGTRRFPPQPVYANGSMPIRRQNGQNLRSDTGRSCCQIRHFPI